MEFIKRTISRGSLLGARTNMVRPVLNPDPLYLNGVNPYPCVEPNQLFDDCINSLQVDINGDGIIDGFVIPPTWLGGVPGLNFYPSWLSDMDEKIIEEFNTFINYVFYEDFELGTSRWYGGAEQYDTKLVWDQYAPYGPQYVETPGNSNIRLEVTEIIGGVIPDTGTLLLQTPSVSPLNEDGTVDEYALSQGINLATNTTYRVSFTISSRVRSHKDFIDNAGSLYDQLRLMIFDAVTQNNVVLYWQSEEIAYFPDKGTLTTTFTAPSGGLFWCTFAFANTPGPTGIINQIGDFFQIDDFKISVEDAVGDAQSFQNIKRKIFGFFKSFNIEPSAYNIELYKNNIIGYLLTPEVPDVDDISLGAYGTQIYDELGQQISYNLTNPPLGVIPFYYLNYNLYGALTTNVQGDTFTNDGFLYCTSPSSGGWEGNTDTYSMGDVVEDDQGELWYCSIGMECNQCSPGECGWVKCLSILAYGQGTLNINIPLYQDIKDMGIYTDVIHPGIAEECEGSVETLTKDYQCPVPYYIQDGGEVMFYDPLTAKEIIVERPCCEDYSEYGFVWWNGKCYLDYGNDLQGQGKELFAFPYSTLFIGRGDNGQLYYDGGLQLPDEIFIESGGQGEIFDSSGPRLLLYTPLVNDIIEGATYIFKAKLTMQEYNSQTLSTIQLGATGQIDPNWSYVYFEDFEVDAEDILQPAAVTCPGTMVEQGVQDGIFTMITDAQSGQPVNLFRFLQQGITYRIRVGYIGLSNNGTLTPYTPAVQQELAINDLEISVINYDTLQNVYFEQIGGEGNNEIEIVFTPLQTTTYMIQFLARNPSCLENCGCENAAAMTYGFGLDFLTIEELPFNYTTDDNTIVTPTKVWSSNSFDAADGLQEIELESEVFIRGAESLSLRVICDVKEPILNSPLTFSLVLSELSFKYFQKPNFLGCKPTHFLNQISNTFTTQTSDFVPTEDGTYDWLNSNPVAGATPLLTFYSTFGAQGIQGSDIQFTSVPYVRPVFGTDHRIIPSAPQETSAQCETSQFIAGWYCNLNYYIEASVPGEVGVPIVQEDGSLGVKGCVGSPVMIPGVTMYSTAAECLSQSECVDIIGCMNPMADNYNPDATEPCFDLDNIPGNNYNCQCAINSTCSDPEGILTNSQYTGYCWGNQEACVDPTQCNSLWVPLLNGGHCCVNDESQWGCTDMGAYNWSGPDIENDLGEQVCVYKQGCPDPEASNYLDPDNNSNCIPAIGDNGNAYACTDCSGNPPSSVYGMVAQSSNEAFEIVEGQLLYPNAIIPGTLGDLSCCNYDDSEDAAVGCTDPGASNFMSLSNFYCYMAVMAGEPCIENGSCEYLGEEFQVWCCIYVEDEGYMENCEDLIIDGQSDYDSFMQNSIDCYDTLNQCVGYTPCVG